jgi:Ras-related protein Rab-2A
MGHRTLEITKAGQEAFKSITRSYYKGSIATLLIFDVTCQLSFNNLHKWLC